MAIEGDGSIGSRFAGEFLRTPSAKVWEPLSSDSPVWKAYRPLCGKREVRGLAETRRFLAIVRVKVGCTTVPSDVNLPKFDDSSTAGRLLSRCMP